MKVKNIGISTSNPASNLCVWNPNNNHNTLSNSDPNPICEFYLSDSNDIKYAFLQRMGMSG